MSFFRHEQALVETDDIGEGTRVWAFTHVMSGAKVGRDCNIGEHCFIEKGAVLGDGVTIKNHVAVWAGVTVEDGAFIGPHASLTNDLRPRSRHAGWTLRETRIGQGVTIGANATLLCGIEIGPFAFVGAGAVVTASVPAHTLVYGNPARPRGFVCRCAEPIAFRNNIAVCAGCNRRYHTDGQGQIHEDHHAE